MTVHCRQCCRCWLLSVLTECCCVAQWIACFWASWTEAKVDGPISSRCHVEMRTLSREQGCRWQGAERNVRLRQNERVRNDVPRTRHRDRHTRCDITESGLASLARLSTLTFQYGPRGSRLKETWKGTGPTQSHSAPRPAMPQPNPTRVAATTHAGCDTGRLQRQQNAHTYSRTRRPSLRD